MTQLQSLTEQCAHRDDVMTCAIVNTLPAIDLFDFLADIGTEPERGLNKTELQSAVFRHLEDKGPLPLLQWLVANMGDE